MNFIGLDIGTSTAKAGIFTEEGKLVHEIERSYTDSLDPRSWLETAIVILRDIEPKSDIAGLCVGSQGPTMVALDKNLMPVCPAFSWMDLRAKEEASLLRERLGRFISSSWIVPKALWLKIHHPEIYSRTRWFVQPMDFFSIRLTGRISAGVASDEIVPWSSEEITAADMDSSKFPQFLVMGDLIGTMTEEANKAIAFPKNTPIFSGAPDFVEAILGTSAVEKGLVCDKAGTSEGIELCWDKKICDSRLFCATHPISPDHCHLGGTIATTGKSLEWLCSIMGLTAQEIDLLAKESPPGSNGLAFFPHLAEERSPFFEQIPGGFLSLSLEHSRSDLARSALEGGAFSIKRVIDAMRELCLEIREIRCTGGQCRSDLWNQIKADVTGLEVIRTEAVHGEVMGAAMIGAFGAGIYPDLKTASQKMAKFGKRFYPNKQSRKIYDELYCARRGLYEIFQSHSSFISHKSRALCNFSDL